MDGDDDDDDDEDDDGDDEDDDRKSGEVGDKMMKKRNGGDFGNPADNHMSESEVGRCAKASGGISICQPFALSDYPGRLGISLELVLYRI